MSSSTNGRSPTGAGPAAVDATPAAERGRQAVDTGVFNENRSFDVEVEYAKASPTDVVIRITATNRGPQAAPLHLLPSLWFRNTWAWQRDDPDPGGLHGTSVPTLRRSGPARIEAQHATLGTYWLDCAGAPALLFCDNETNAARLWGGASRTPFASIQGGQP